MKTLTALEFLLLVAVGLAIWALVSPALGLLNAINKRVETLEAHMKRRGGMTRRVGMNLESDSRQVKQKVKFEDDPHFRRNAARYLNALVSTMPEGTSISVSVSGETITVTVTYTDSVATDGMSVMGAALILGDAYRATYDEAQLLLPLDAPAEGTRV